MDAVAAYVVKMALPACAGALLWAVTRPWRRCRLEKCGKEAGPCREGALLLLFMFLFGLLWLTLTPPDLEYFLRTGQWLSPPGIPLRDRVNLVPLTESLRLFRFYWEREMWNAILVNFPGNIVMFLPIGFFAGLFSDKPRWWKGTLWAFALSLFIETAQLFVSRGTDIDDLILNTLGGLLGYGLFSLLRRADPGLVRRCAKQRKGSASHGD